MKRPAGAGDEVAGTNGTSGSLVGTGPRVVPGPPTRISIGECLDARAAESRARSIGYASDGGASAANIDVPLQRLGA